VFTFQFQITDDDYFEYNLYHRYSIPAYREQAIMPKYIILIFLLAFGIAWGLLWKDATYYILFGIASILWLACYKQSFVVNPIRKNKKLMKRVGKVPFDQDITMTFTEEKIESESHDAHMSASYSSIEKIVTGENALYLYKSAIEAYIVPNRVFSGEAEKAVFLQFIQGKTNAEILSGVTK